MEMSVSSKNRSTLKKWHIVVGVLLSIALMTMADDDVTANTTVTSSAQGCEPLVCTSRDCVIVASEMAAIMNPEIDPCQDFAQYACGGFYKNTVIPADKTDITSYNALLEDIDRLLRKFMADPIKKDVKEYVKKLKRFYSTCMDEDKIEEIGLKPYTNTDFPNEWPTLNPTWNDSTFDVNDLVVKNVQDEIPLFKIYIDVDVSNSIKHILNFGQSGTSLSLDYYKLPRNSTAMVAFRQFYVDVAVALGADEAIAVNDADDLIDLERQFASISVLGDEMTDESDLINPTTLDEMSVTYPYIDWHRAIQARFDLINYTVPKDLPVNIATPQYFARLGGLLSLTKQPRYKRIVQNKFGFTNAVSHVGSLTKEMRKISFKYQNIYTGLETDVPRWKQCYRTTRLYFKDAVGKMYVTERFPEESKKSISTMVNAIKKSFSGMLRDADWMSPKTKEAAFLKMTNLRVKIGYPDENFSEEDIDHEYENYTVWDGEYYKTVRNIETQRIMKSLRDLNEPADTVTFDRPTWDVGAYADPSANEIAFPAGILMAPFFSKQSPSSVNYGGVGGVIGHELTHIFDSYGSQYDHNGNVNNWWQSRDLEEFKNRTQCIIDQYSSFWLDEIDMYANGKATVGDDLADIASVKEAYRAYKTVAASQPEEIPLPGLGLTTDQQFFLAYGQSYCEKETPEFVRAKVLSDESSSASRLSIQGPIMNSEDFARVYQCPTGSPMNPAKKCVVW